MSAKVRSKREIEVKLRVSDVSDIVARLRSLGAKQRGRVFEQNTVFDTPRSALQRSGCLLRLRVETPARSNLVFAGPRRALLTFKAPTDGRSAPGKRYKEKTERELSIQNPAEWLKTFRSAGFRPAFRYEKYRSSFILRDLHLDLDETPIGAFLELEGSPSAIDRAARALGFNPSAYIRATYWNLYVADCRRRAKKPLNLIFRA